MTELIKLNKVSKIFGPFNAVNKVSFDIKRGDTIALLGPNGAGKTTIVKMIAGLIKPTYGEILISNTKGNLQDINRKSTNLIKMGFLIDVPSFYKAVSAYQILRFLGRAQGVPKKKLESRIENLLKLFRLYRWRNEKVQYFSKGMKQKLGIISAMLIDPEILILDEPQTGIDPKARVEVRKIISSLNKELGKTILICSHMIHEISQICDKIAFMNKGKLIAYDKIENLQKKLKINEITCQILDPISSEIDNLVEKISTELKPYLDYKIEPPIQYFYDTQQLRIYFDGRRKTKADMLDILTTKFKSEFRLISYSQERSNLLEQLYTETIV